MNEETAVECLKAGANDYIIKEHLTRLPFAVKEALEQHRILIEKRAAELLLKENEEKLQSIFRAAPVGIGLVVNWVFMEVNDTFCKMTGYNRKELIGKPTEMVVPTRKEYEFISLEEKRLIAEKGTASVESRLKCKDGRILDIITSATPLDPSDLSKGLTFTVLDITERKQAEKEMHISLAKYKTLFECFPLGVTVSDDAGNIVETNPTAEKLLGVSHNEQIQRDIDGQEWCIVRPDGTPMPREEYASVRALKQRCKVENVEMGIVKPDNTITWINVTAAPLPLERYGVVITYNDITGRKLGEEALVESETKYRQLVTRSPDGIFIIDLSGKFISVNRAICDNLKYTEEEFLSMMMQDIVPEQYHSLHKQRLMAIMKGESTNVSAEYEVKGKDGIGHFVEVLSVPYYEGKEIVGFQGIARDITERKKTEEALRESEEKYRLLIDTANESIIVAQDGLLKFVNKMTIELLEEYSEQELIGRPFSEFIHPDDKRTVVENYRRRIANEAAQQRYAFRVITRNGIIKWVEINAVLIEWQGKPATLNFLSDITERKQTEIALRSSEEKYRRIFENVQDLYYEVLIDGTILEVSPSIGILSKGQYQMDDLIGKSMSDFYYEPEKRQALLAVLQEKGAVTDFEITLKNRDGSKIPCSISSKICFDAQGRPEKIIGSMRDITDRKHAEKVLKENESSLRDAQEIAKMGSWEWDIVTQKTNWSDNYFVIHGYKPAEIEPSFELFRSRIHPDDVHLLDETHAVIMKDKTPSSFELRLTQPDGTFKWIQNSISPVVEADKLVKLKGVIIDITERKRAEEALKISEERFRTAAENLTDVVYDWDIKEKVDWYGDIDGIMGYPSGGFPRTIKGWAATIHPEDKDRVMMALEGHLKGLSPYQIEYRVGRRDGEWRWWSARGKALRDNRGEPCKMIGSITDITEQKRAAEALLESEMRYKRLFSNAAEGILVAKIETMQFLYANPVLCKMFGYTEEELIRLSVKDIHPKESLDYVLAEFEAQSQGEKMLASDLPCIRKDGTLFHADIRSTSMVLDGFKCNVGFFIDITDQKLAEDKLRNSEERLKILFDYAPDAYYLNDLKGYFIDGNIACEKLMGYDKNELIGKSFLKLKLLSSKQMPRAAKLLIKNSLRLGTGPDEFVLTRKDGSKVPVEIITHPVKIKDKTLVLGLARDISERKMAEKALRESEEKFRSIMENSTDAMFLIDQQGRFVYANKAVTTMSGYTIEEVKKKTIIDLSPADRIDEYLKLFSQVLKEGGLNFELDILRKDGDIISTDLNSALLPNGLIYASCRDITEKKQAQKELLKHRDHLEELVNERTEELSKAKKEAEEANKAKSEFLANMSHEIRTPMNAVLGYTELLSSMLVDQTQKNYINSIKSSGRSLLTLINDILDLSKIEAGKLEMEYEYVDTYSFFSEFERIFSLKVSEKGLKFILDITSGTPAGINIDEARVRQIVFNLIGNAIKFTSEGKIVLKVFTENPQIVNYSKEKSEELIDLIIEVQDTGIGISTELQEAIFEPFVQERDNKHLGGTGLGLTITRRLTALMDGTIRVQSKPGKGSIFTVRIPEIAYLRDFSKTTVDIQIDPSEILFEKASVLIADDVEHNRSYLRDALKNTRLKIVEAEDGIAAYKLAKEIVPDLIIADILMPKMDGFRLLDKIKTDKKLKHIPVIAYSASVLKGQKERIHNSEFAGLLIKPVKVAELYLELMRFLPYKSIKAAEPDKPLSEVDLIGEITNLPGLIHSLETDFYTTWKTFTVRQPIREIRDFGNNLIQSGMDHNSSIITGYGKELISAADSFNIEAILKLIGKYKGIIESLKDSTKNLNND